VALAAGFVLVLAACGDDSTSGDGPADDLGTQDADSPDDTVDNGDPDIGDDTDTGDTVDDGPLGELSTTVLASWDTDQPRLRSLVVTDRDALLLERDAFETTIVAVDLGSGEIRTNPGVGFVTDLLQTATNGVFGFDVDECTYRSVDPDDLSLGEGVGELTGESCSSGTDLSLVRGDVIWTVQPDALHTIDTTTGETRSLRPSAISDRFADDDTPSGALLDLGDAVLVTYFESGDELTAFSARVDDDLMAGPLVEVARLPRLDNGVLVDDATDDEGFTQVVVLDRFTLEVTDETPPQPPMWGTVSCDPTDSLRSHPGPDGSVWVGPLEADGEIVVARCRDGREIARGQVDHDQFSDVGTDADALYYLATVRAEPDEDGMSSFEVVGEVLVRVSPPN
jgi:hypothetical protein